METLTRVLARHVYSLDLTEAVGGGGDARGTRGARRVTPVPVPLPRPAQGLSTHHQSVAAANDARTPGKLTFMCIFKTFAPR